MNKIMSSSAQFWATKHFMTPTAKHQGDLGRDGGNHLATKPENPETLEKPHPDGKKNPPTESQRKSESPHEAINNHQSFVESNYHPLRCSSVMNLFWGFSRPQHLVSLCFALGPQNQFVRLRDPTKSGHRSSPNPSPAPTILPNSKLLALPQNSCWQLLTPTATSDSICFPLVCSVRCC